MRSQVLDKEWRLLCSRWAETGYRSLTDDERIWFNIRLLVDAINNGGLISYFYNPSADTFSDCVTALERLNAAIVLEQLHRLAALFGDSVPASIEKRNAIIESWPDYGEASRVCENADEVLISRMAELDSDLTGYLLSRGFSCGDHAGG